MIDTRAQHNYSSVMFTLEALEQDPTIVVEKQAKKSLRTRLVWNYGPVRLRVDVAITEAGVTSEAWALYHDNRLVTVGQTCPSADLLEVVEFLDIEVLTASILVADWVDQVNQRVFEVHAAGEFWASGTYA